MADAWGDAFKDVTPSYSSNSSSSSPYQTRDLEKILSEKQNYGDLAQSQQQIQLLLLRLLFNQYKENERKEKKAKKKRKKQKKADKWIYPLLLLIVLLVICFVVMHKWK